MVWSAGIAATVEQLVRKLLQTPWADFIPQQQGSASLRASSPRACFQLHTLGLGVETVIR